MIILTDFLTGARYTVKPTLDGKWSIFRRTVDGKKWSRVKSSPIRAYPEDAALDLIEFQTRNSDRRWRVVDDPDATSWDLFDGYPSPYEMLPEEPKVKKANDDMDAQLIKNDQ